MRSDLGEPGHRGWTPTPALYRAVLFVGVLMLAAVLLRRFDLVALAAPTALGTAASLSRRPGTVPTPALSVAEPAVAEGATVVARAVLDGTGPAGYDLGVARVGASARVRLDGGDRAYAAPDAGGRVELELQGRVVRWGRSWIGPVAARATACDGLLIGDVTTAPAVPVAGYPLAAPFAADSAMPRAAGLVGQHRSRRPGEGGDLAEIRAFAAGDRLRRIDWRVTLRTSRLHVASTLSDRDAEVVLLLDLLSVAGVGAGVDAAASTLDVTVRAAAAIAGHYLRVGDRVSLLEYGTTARRLRPVSGLRQYTAVLEWLLDVRAGTPRHDPAARVLHASRIPPSALVVVLSPLLDERTAALLARFARSGRFVAAVDTLTAAAPAVLADPTTAAAPAVLAGLVGRPGGAWTPIASRLWRLERSNTIEQLREHGVPVIAWAGANSLDVVLRDVARLGSAPRSARR